LGGRRLFEHGRRTPTRVGLSRISTSRQL
jgi:hypothetical protein